MSMLTFMPWCRIDKLYKVDKIEILPFNRRAPVSGIDDAGQCRVNTIMGIYKDIEGRPVDSAALIHYSGKTLIDDLNEEEMAEMSDLMTLACFSGLAKREYFNPVGPYCNSDCFTLYSQKFDKAKFTTLRTRRREGSTSSVWPIDDLAVTVPVHCHTIEGVTLNEILLNALIAYRKQSSAEEWGKWQNALTCFNQANTDSDNIRHQVEWVLLCSSFEHILGAKSEAKDVASKFSELVVPSDSLLVPNASRRSDRWNNNGQSFRYEWMREFYRIRGDFAHGKLNTQHPTVWNPLEHLALAAIAFSMVVKCLLKKASLYELTDVDQAQIDVFERFADTQNFLKPPANQKDSLDSHWKRLVGDRSRRIFCEKASDEAWNSLTPEQQQSLEGNINTSDR